MQNLSTSSASLRKSIALGIGMGVILALVFAAGFFVRDAVAGTNPNLSLPVGSLNASTNYPLLSEVQVLVDRYYLRPQPDAKAREYAAIRGMLASLEDRYTFFIDPPVARSESDVLAGTYGGIGVTSQRTEAGEIALYPYPESPAKREGVEDGDIVVEINGTPVDVTMQQDQIDQMFRGEVKEGSGVELTLRKASTSENVTIFVPFEVINVPSVLWRVMPDDERLGYIQIMRFTSRTPEELANAANDLLQVAGVSSIVLDLRNNSGGLLQESIQVADAFIDDGIIAYERKQNSEESFSGTEGGLITDLPLIVLVNQNTASGAELVAGAIQDSDRGMLIGQRTFGKGTVQQIYGLSDGSSLHVTSAEWLTPNRTQLTNNGLVPDIEMIPDSQGRDVELGEAIRQLQTILSTAS